MVEEKLCRKISINTFGKTTIMWLKWFQTEVKKDICNLINHFPNSPRFSGRYKRRLSKTLLDKKKMLVPDGNIHTHPYYMLFQVLNERACPSKDKNICGKRTKCWFLEFYLFPTILSKNIFHIAFKKKMIRFLKIVSGFGHQIHATGNKST